MSKILLHHPFIYRLLFRCLQYVSVTKGDSEKTDLKNFQLLRKKTITTTDYENWKGKLAGGGISRGTFAKLSGFPADTSSKVALSTLDSSVLAIASQLPHPQDADTSILSFLNDNIEGDLIGIGNKKLSTVLKNSGDLFHLWMGTMLFPEEIIPDDYTNIERNVGHQYLSNYTKAEQDQIDLRVEFTIAYNFLIQNQAERSELIRVYDLKIDELYKNSIFLHYKIRQKEKGDKPFTLGVFPFQDTILPKFYEPVYQSELNIKIEEVTDWGAGINYLKSGQVDVLLGSYPLYLSGVEIDDKDNSLISPYLFWPLFSFSGYSIIVAKEKLGAQYQNINPDWQDIKDQQLLKGMKIIYEKGTDFEWAAHSILLKKLNIAEDDLEVVNLPTNEGKKAFVDGKADIYCTNCVQLFDLTSLPDFNNRFLILAFGKKDFQHDNFNGFIASDAFINENFKAFAELVNCWFNSIKHFQKEVIAPYLELQKTVGNIILKSANKPRINMVAESITTFINKQSGTNISVANLMQMYPLFDVFHPTPEVAIDAFLSDDHLEENKILQQYFEIMRLTQKTSEDDSFRLDDLKKLAQMTRDKINRFAR